MERVNFNNYARLSESAIWAIEKEKQQQIDMPEWFDLPYSVANNVTAFNYVNSIKAFIADLLSKYGTETRVNILELNSGRGRLGFLILKELNQVYAEQGVKPFNYIMADSSRGNLEFSQQHSKLKGYISTGQLSFAHYQDNTHCHELTSLDGDSLKNQISQYPLIVISNLFFEQLPYDLFKFQSGQVLEYQIALSGVTSAIESLKYQDNYELVLPESSYSSEFTRLLNYYKSRLPESVVQIPTSAIQLINQFKSLSPKLLWLFSAAGTAQLRQINQTHQNGFNPDYNKANGFNLHALNFLSDIPNSRFFENTYSSPEFDSYAILTTNDDFSYPHTEYSLTDRQGPLRPANYSKLYQSLLKNSKSLDLDGLLSLIEMSHFDAAIIKDFTDAVGLACKTAVAHNRTTLIRYLINIYSNYYDIGEPFNVEYHLAKMLYRLNNLQNAVTLFKNSVSRHDDQSHEKYFHIGNTLIELGKIDEAATYLKTALWIDPDYRPAQVALERIDQKIL